MSSQELRSLERSQMTTMAKVSVDEQTPEVVIAIEKRFRRQGLGTRLMETLADEARRLGFEHLRLSVNHANEAKHLYETLGYRIIGDDGRSSIMRLTL